jgi:hypothetical protein
MAVYSKVYDSYAQAESAVRDLEAAGVPSADISLVANKYVSEQYADVNEASATSTGIGLGAAAGGGAGLLAGLGLLAIPGLGPVVAAGWFAATAAGAAAGAATGGIIGALVDAGTSEPDAHVYSEAVRRGGTLLTVRTSSASADTIDRILNQYDPIDPARRRQEYEQTGWRESTLQLIPTLRAKPNWIGCVADDLKHTEARATGACFGRAKVCPGRKSKSDRYPLQRTPRCENARREMDADLEGLSCSVVVPSYASGAISASLLGLQHSRRDGGAGRKASFTCFSPLFLIL